MNDAELVFSMVGAASIGWGLVMIFNRRDGGLMERAVAVGLIIALTALAITFIGAQDYGLALRAAAFIAILGVGLEESIARAPRVYAPGAPVARATGASPYGRRWRRTRRPRPYH